MTTTLLEQIEEMRIRMHEQARNEQHLVNTLGLALKRADERLLQAIGNVAVEHKLRREDIMKELQLLAAHIGSLPLSPGRHSVREDAPLTLRSAEASLPMRGTADWRQAMANLPDVLAN
jgi:hypothetical protein